MLKFSLYAKCQLEISDYIQYDQINWNLHGTVKNCFTETKSIKEKCFTLGRKW